MDTYFKGFFLSASLIMAIGAQNAFVLRQGVARQHVFVAALVSSLCDVVLISVGVGGLGAVVTGNPTFTMIATWGGGLFLLYYGGRSFYSAYKGNALDLTAGDTEATWKRTALAAMGFSLLNPHAWIDTVVLIGGLGAQFPPEERVWFGMGAYSYSFVWFFALAYGATRLTPLFENPNAARVLDVLVGLLMWGIAASLVFGL